MWTSLSDFSGAPSLKIARIEFLSGAYDRALESIDATSSLSPGLFLFKAHVLYRMRRRSDALHVLSDGRKSDCLVSGDTLQLADAIEASCLADLGKAKEATKMLERIGPAGTSVRSGGEAAYYIASARYMLKQYDRALQIIDEFDSSADSNLAARFEFLRGWIHAAGEGYVEQIACNTRALALLASNVFPDVGLQALALRSIAALARDMARADMIPLITQTEASLRWTDALAFERFQTMRTLAWANAMNGEYILAIRQLHRAKEIAPTAHTTMLSHLDHAWIASVSNEPLHLQVELTEAAECFKDVDWERTSDEQIGALLLAALLQAPADTELAGHYFEQAAAARAHLSKGLAIAHDRRLGAFFDEAETALRRARGDRRVAIHRAKRAMAAFEAMGFRWRAAQLAITLFEMTKDATWLNGVDEVAQIYPRSFIAQRAAKLMEKGASPLLQLTPQQREVVAGIRRGLQNNELAKELGQPRNTIRSHKARIFRLFGVRNELELLKRLIDLEAA